MSEINLARDAIFSIPADLPRADWVRVGMSAHAAGLSYADFNEWSAQAESYEPNACSATWRSFRSGKGIGSGTLFLMAREHGWAGHTGIPSRPNPQDTSIGRSGKIRSDMSADRIWQRCEPVSNGHFYIQSKQAMGVALDGLRLVPSGDGLTIAGERMAGALVVPVKRSDGLLSSLQFITPTDVATRLKAKGMSGKINLPNHLVQGWFTVGELVHGGVIYIVEGIGQAWACWQATGATAVVCFGAGNMGKVANALHSRDPSSRLVLVPDVGQEENSRKIAAEVGAYVAVMPEGEINNFDANDLAQRDGRDELAKILEGAIAPPFQFPVSVAFADELGDMYEPPDELIEGLLTAEDGSVLYGD